MGNGFEIKDSGEREQFESGMVRDTEDDKVDYTLVLDGPMFERWAEHLHGGAKKYAPRNWLQATGEVELERFRRSALRHLLQWLGGERDEDHAAAVIFNLNGAEYVQARMEWEMYAKEVLQVEEPDWEQYMGDSDFDITSDEDGNWSIRVPGDDEA